MTLFKKKPKIIQVKGGWQIEGKSAIYAEKWQAEAHAKVGK